MIIAKESKGIEFVKKKKKLQNAVLQMLQGRKLHFWRTLCAHLRRKPLDNSSEKKKTCLEE